MDSMDIDDHGASSSAQSANPFDNEVIKVSGNAASMFADDGSAPASSAAPEFQGTTAQKIAHKLWNVRLRGFEELKSTFAETSNPSDPLFSEYASSLHKYLGEVNPQVLDKAIEAIEAFVDKAAIAPQYVAPIAVALIDKCFSKPKPKEKAQKVLLLQMEVDTPLPVVSELIEKGLTHKQAKVPAGALETLTKAAKFFSIEGWKLKDLLKHMFPLLEHKDEAVRSEAISLLTELHRWIGQAAMDSLLADKVRPAQRKDLEDKFAANPKEPPVPEKRLRKDIAAGVAAPSAGKKAAASSVNVFDMLDAVNVVSKLPKDFLDSLADPAWKVRKEALDNFVAAASVSKIQNFDYSEHVRTMKKLLNDSNAAIVATSIKSLSLLASGLRRDFNAAAKGCVSIFLEKFKESKRIQGEIHGFLEAAVPNCLVLPDVHEDIAEACNSKNPPVRENTLQWISKTLVTHGSSALVPPAGASNKAAMKALSEILVKSTNDANNDVRELAYGCVAHFITATDNAYTSMLDKIDATKATKIREMIAGGGAAAASKKFSSFSAPAPVHDDNAPSPRSGASTPRSIGSNDGVSPSNAALASSSSLPSSRPKTAPAASLARSASSSSSSSSAAAPKKPASAASSSSAPAASAAAKGKKAAVSADDEDVSAAVSSEEMDLRAIAFIPETIQANLSSKNFKERIQGMEDLAAFLSSSESAVEEEKKLPTFAELIVRFIAKKPGWKDSQIMIISRVFELLSTVFASAVQVSRAAAYLTIRGAMEKIHEAKANKPIVACLTAICEARSPNFAFVQIYKLLKDEKNPKVTLAVLDWMATTVQEFSLKSFQPKPLIEFCKEMLESTDPKIKASTIQLLCTMRKYLPSLKDLLGELKPALMASIESEFAKVADAEPPPPPTRAIKSGSDEGGAAGGSFSDSLRKDISSELTSSIIKGMSDGAWKVRVESLTEVESIINRAGKMIMPTIGNELVGAMKKTVADSNQAVMIKTIQLFGLLATAIGPACEKPVRPLISPISELLQSIKGPVRETSFNALDAFVASSCSLDAVLRESLKLLAEDNAAGRLGMLKLLCKHVPLLKTAAKDLLQSTVKPLLSCLQDRSPDVKKEAETFLIEIARILGTNSVTREAQDLKQAVKQSLQPILARITSEAASASSSSSPAESAPAALVAPVAAAPAPVPAAPAPASLKRPGSALPVGFSSSASQAADALPPRPQTALPRSGSSSSSASSSAFASIPSSVDGKINRMRRAPSFMLNTGSDAKASITVLTTLVEEACAVLGDALGRALCASVFAPKPFDELMQMSRANPTDFLNVTDVVFKICSCRLYTESAPTQLGLVYNVIHAAFEIMAQQQPVAYKMNEFESSCIVPALVDKIEAKASASGLSTKQLLKTCLELSDKNLMAKTLVNAYTSTAKTANKVSILDSLKEFVDIYGMTPDIKKNFAELAGHIMQGNDQASRKAGTDFFTVLAGKTDVSKLVTVLDDDKKKKFEEKFGKAVSAVTSVSATIVRKPSASAASSSSAAAAASSISVSASMASLPPPPVASADLETSPSGGKRTRINIMKAPVSQSVDFSALSSSSRPASASSASSASASSMVPPPPVRQSAAPSVSASIPSFDSSSLSSSSVHSLSSSGIGLPPPPSKPMVSSASSILMASAAANGYSSSTLPAAFEPAPTPKLPSRSVSRAGNAPSLGPTPMDFEPSFSSFSSSAPSAYAPQTPVSAAPLPPFTPSSEDIVMANLEQSPANAFASSSSLSRSVSAASAASAASSAPVAAAAVPSIKTLEWCLRTLDSESPDMIVDALKNLSLRLKRDDQSSQAMLPTLLPKLANVLDKCLAQQPVHARLCKYLILTLMDCFKRPLNNPNPSSAAEQQQQQASLIPFLSREVLQQLTDSLLSRLAEQQNHAESEESKNLLRAMQILFFRIVDSSSKTMMVSCLLQSFKRAWSETEGLPSSTAQAASRLQVADVIQRSLLKCASAQYLGMLEDFDLEAVLCEVHDFLQSHPPSRFRDNNGAGGAAGASPVRVIKTLLLEITRICGEKLREIMEATIPSTSFVCQYVNLMLQEQEREKQRSLAAPVPSAPSAVSSSVPVTRPAIPSLSIPMSIPSSSSSGSAPSSARGGASSGDVSPAAQSPRRSTFAEIREAVKRQNQNTGAVSRSQHLQIAISEIASMTKRDSVELPAGQLASALASMQQEQQQENVAIVPPAPPASIQSKMLPPAASAPVAFSTPAPMSAIPASSAPPASVSDAPSSNQAADMKSRLAAIRARMNA